MEPSPDFYLYENSIDESFNADAANINRLEQPRPTIQTLTK
jgi:hypothetical protein